MSVEERNLTVLPEAAPPKAPVNRSLAFRGLEGLKESILAFPTFFQHFDGAKVDWRYLRARSTDQLAREAGWLERQSLRLTVDFSSGLNFYPDLTLLDNMVARYEESCAIIDEVMDRMVILGAREAVITLHREPEFKIPDEEVEERFLRGMRSLCRRAEERGITLHLQHCPGESFYGVDTSHPEDPALNLGHHRLNGTRAPPGCWHSSSGVGATNLDYALNTGHATMDGETLAEAVAAIVASSAKLGCILVSAPTADRFEQSYDTHTPVAAAGLDLSRWQRSELGDAPIVSTRGMARGTRYIATCGLWGEHHSRAEQEVALGKPVATNLRHGCVIDDVVHDKRPPVGQVHPAGIRGVGPGRAVVVDCNDPAELLVRLLAEHTFHRFPVGEEPFAWKGFPPMV